MYRVPRLILAAAALAVGYKLGHRRAEQETISWFAQIATEGRIGPTGEILDADADAEPPWQAWPTDVEPKLAAQRRNAEDRLQ